VEDRLDMGKERVFTARREVGEGRLYMKGNKRNKKRGCMVD
jgi:hypothetical protein